MRRIGSEISRLGYRCRGRSTNSTRQGPPRSLTRLSSVGALAGLAARCPLPVVTTGTIGFGGGMTRVLRRSFTEPGAVALSADSSVDSVTGALACSVGDTADGGNGDAAGGGNATCETGVAVAAVGAAAARDQLNASGVAVHVCRHTARRPLATADLCADPTCWIRDHLCSVKRPPLV